MRKGDYPRAELCLAQRKNDPGPCQNLRNHCQKHCNSALRKKPGERCAQRPMANGRCARHGGKAVRGMAHPRFRTGETSRYYPKGNLTELYNRAYDAGAYTELKDEIALITAMTNQVLADREESAGEIFKELNKERLGLQRANLANDRQAAAGHLNAILSLIGCGVTAEMQRGEAVKLMDHRRKLVDSEARRLEREQQTVTLEQVMMRDMIMLEALREMLSAEQLHAIRQRLEDRLGHASGPL